MLVLYFIQGYLCVYTTICVIIMVLYSTIIVLYYYFKAGVSFEIKSRVSSKSKKKSTLKCCGLYYKQLRSYMMIIRDETIWSITQEPSIMLLNASIVLLEDIYSTGHSG